MSFIKNVAILITGTSIAQAIPIAISPILTRLYDPESFGELMLYLSIISIISVIATGRYELAIVQSKSIEEAKVLVFVSFGILSIVSIIILLIVFLYNFFDLNYWRKEVINNCLYLIPISIFLVGSFNILNYWFLYLNKYEQISRSKAYQSINISFFQIICSFSKSIGLIIGQVIGQLFIVLYMWRELSKEEKFFFYKMDLCLKYIKYYKEMPCYSMPGAFADNLSLQMPILVINKYFDTYITGMFGLTFRILSLPSALLSRSISQVLYKRINTSIGLNGLVHFLIKLFFLLILIYSPIVIVIWMYGEEIFAIVFGEGWRQAGLFAQILVIAILVRFAVSPLSAIVAMKDNIRLGVAWQFLYLITISIVLIYFSQYNIEKLLWAFVVHEIVLYILYFFIILIGARRLQEKSLCVE